MLGKNLISSFLTNAAKKEDRSPLEMAFSQCVKSYRKIGIKLRQAMLINPDGTTVAREGDIRDLTDCDIEKIRNILMNGDECHDVLHLDSLYFCVKELSDRTMVLFNGANYIIACLTPSNHLIVLDMRARKADGAQTITWIQSVAEQLHPGVNPNKVKAMPRGRSTQANLLDWF